MAFQEDIARLNEFFFFREFTFSKTTFSPNPNQELELADNVISLAEILFVYQIKERVPSNINLPEQEAKWFKKKVLGEATKQIRDTLTYLENNKAIRVLNHRGDAFDISMSTVRSFHKLVLYLPLSVLPVECRHQKHHCSRTAGFIHLISADDYRDVINTLRTPAEFADYLEFRAMLVERWQLEVDKLPESALLGQYLKGDSESSPHLSFSEYVKSLKHDSAIWDMSWLIKLFPERIITTKLPTDYYSIITELAKLNRSDWEVFKKRFDLSIEAAKSNKAVVPYRFSTTKVGCGFVFVPLTSDMLKNRQNGLKNLTFANKYDQKLPKCIGVSFAKDTDGTYLVEWCFVEFPWQEDTEMAEMLSKSYPFRPVNAVEAKRYEFNV